MNRLLFVIVCFIVIFAGQSNILGGYSRSIPRYKNELNHAVEQISVFDKNSPNEHSYIPLYSSKGRFISHFESYLKFDEENDFLKHGFPKNQDVSLEDLSSGFRFWIKGKKWVKSVGVYGVVGEKDYLLKTIYPLHSEDNRVMLNGILSKRSDGYLATSAVIELPQSCRVLKVDVPFIVGYSNHVKKDAIFSFDKLVIKVFEKEHLQGRFVSIDYDLFDRLNLERKNPSLKMIASLKRNVYDIAIYEYRNISFGLTALSVKEGGNDLKSLFVSEFFRSFNSPLQITNSIRVLQWLYDLKTKENVIRFAVLLTKDLGKKNVNVIVHISNDSLVEDKYQLPAVNISKE